LLRPSLFDVECRKSESAPLIIKEFLCAGYEPGYWGGVEKDVPYVVALRIAARDQDVYTPYWIDVCEMLAEEGELPVVTTWSDILSLPAHQREIVERFLRLAPNNRRERRVTPLIREIAAVLIKTNPPDSHVFSDVAPLIQEFAGVGRRP